MPQLRPAVLAAKGRLAEGREHAKRRHREGCSGIQLCAAMAGVRDEVLRELYEGALAGLGAEEAGPLGGQIALVAHGGYGRCDVAPYSDVDLMILRRSGTARRAGRLAERLLCDVFDAGLTLGHSVRTPDEACRLACRDATICSSLVESRWLIGSVRLFREFVEKFQARVRRHGAALARAMEQARWQERLRFGETVYLLEPNIKRSRGGLREIQLLRWVGMARYGTPEPEALQALGVLWAEDLEVIRQATEFLLRLRNEMHFHAGRASDVLDRGEQLRIARQRGYQPVAGLLPVEQFMRDYFRHTDQVSHVVGRFLDRARPARRGVGWTALLGHRIAGGFVVGPQQIAARRHAADRLRGDLAAIMELVALASVYDKEIAAETWEMVRQAASRLPPETPPPAEACRSFLAIFDRAGRLGELLRGLHEVGLLERFVPAFTHARGLLQFNQYHKYTVDEHCLRSVERATEFAADAGPAGRVYRALARKRILHLALLLHDLGKGHPDDHREAGRRIAIETARRLGLDADEGAALEFLVHKHLVMNHLAFRRDTSDERLIVRFAVEVGSPERLQMLYLLTWADLAAVGPDNWTGWKGEVLTDLYHRTMEHLAGESPGTSRDEYLAGRREAVRTWLGPDGDRPWFVRQVESLPVSYLHGTDPHQIAADLRLLAALGPGDVYADGHYQPESHTIQFTIGTREDVTPGIFHKLTGALTGQGLEILSAQIHTLADDLVLDRFWVHDPDFSGQPPAERLGQVRGALVEALLSGGKPPSFRRVWTIGGTRHPTAAVVPTRVEIDNTISDHYTIIDVFTIDHRGLLYAIARTLFELSLSVWRAKIGTFLDQVVDVFYVTGQGGEKVEDPDRLHEIRRRLIEVIEAVEKDGAGEDH